MYKDGKVVGFLEPYVKIYIDLIYLIMVLVILLILLLLLLLLLNPQELMIIPQCYCDAPIPGVPLITRQPAETYEYRVLQYHTHMSHTSRPIYANFSHNNLQEFDVQLVYTFTCQDILKLDCSNIFYKILLKAKTRPSSYSRPRRSVVFSCT